VSDARIRPTSIDDAEALKSLRIEALRSHPLAFTADLPDTESKPIEWWQERAARGGGEGSEVILVADAQGRLVGMSGIYTPTQPKLAHSGIVWGVYVRSEFRRRGIGKALLQACVDWARGKKLVMLRLSVAAGNFSAERCYQGSGFVTYGVEPMAIQLDGRFYDETLMAIRL
jgi:ribosomal protein S18 acetylase RimI-like enzyme